MGEDTGQEWWMRRLVWEFSPRLWLVTRLCTVSLALGILCFIMQQEWLELREGEKEIPWMIPGIKVWI